MSTSRVIPGLLAALFALTASGCGSKTGTCEPGDRSCIDNSVYVCIPSGSQRVLAEDCGIDALCISGNCVPKVIGSDSGVPDSLTPEPVPDASDDVSPVTDVSLETEVPADAKWDVDVSDPDGMDTSETVSEIPTSSDAPGAEEVGETGWIDILVETVDGGPSVPCGNGLIDPGEDCDGDNLDGKNCQGLLYAPGSLACKTDCSFDTLLCGDNSHRLAYEAVPNLLVKDDFVDVAWHPEGNYAVVLGYSGAVIRFDPEAAALDSLAIIGNTGDVFPKRVDFAPSGAAYVVGHDADGDGHVFEVPAGGESLVVLDGAGQKARFVSIKFAPSGNLALIAGQSGDYTINSVCTFDPVSGTTSDFKGYAASAGVSDFMWVPGFGTFEGILGALLVHGWNGKDAHIWLDINKEINPAGNGTASFGNMGRCAYRPGAQYGLVCGTSSNVLYVYAGNVNLPSWSKEYLKDFGSGVLEVAFRPDGKRALVLGRPWGDPLTLHIQEHRPKSITFSGDDFIQQDLPDWDQSPFFANSNTYLQAAAFRPGVSCDEGLMVGDHPGSQFAPTWGTVVLFRDTDAMDCP